MRTAATTATATATAGRVSGPAAAASSDAASDCPRRTGLASERGEAEEPDFHIGGRDTSPRSRGLQAVVKRRVG